MIFESIRRLRHRMRGEETPQTRRTLSDKALARRLHQTFERDLEETDLRGLHFYAHNGVVTLYGTIRHEFDRDLLVMLVRDIPGVVDVVAHLQVVDQPFQKTDPATQPDPA